MILNGKISNPGELRTSIVLGSPVLTESTGGFKRKSFVAAATVKAKWANVHGSEVWVAQSDQVTDPATVLIRYRTGIDSTWGVQKGSQWYEIVSLDDILDRHEYIELKVKRTISG